MIHHQMFCSVNQIKTNNFPFAFWRKNYFGSHFVECIQIIHSFFKPEFRSICLFQSGIFDSAYLMLRKHNFYAAPKYIFCIQRKEIFFWKCRTKVAVKLTREQVRMDQSAGVVEYTDCTSNEYPDLTLNNLMVRSQ